MGVVIAVVAGLVTLAIVAYMAYIAVDIYARLYCAIGNVSCGSCSPSGERSSSEESREGDVSSLLNLKRSAHIGVSEIHAEKAGKCREYSSQVDEDVCIAVVAPSRVKAGDHMMVQVVGAEISELQEVVRIAMDEDAENEACRRGGIRTEVSHGQVVSFDLSSPKFVVEDGHQEVTWDGNAFNVRFDVSVPDSCRTGSVISKVEVSIDGISIGRILFVTNVSSDESVECRTQSRTVAEVNRYFFISYADKDAERVTHYVEGIQLGAGCDDEHIFFARNSIGKGDDWFAKICDFIDNKADVVVLFWTENSAVSENVRDEYLRALKKNVPVSPIIFSRPFPPPPKELRKLSFTDRYAYMK